MRIALLVPAGTLQDSGNDVTARRWARHLRALGHRVWLDEEGGLRAADLVLALHARKSARAVARQRRRHGDAPLVVGLAGTDLYRDLPRSRAAQALLESAWRIVALQDLAARELPGRLRDRVRVIVQSVPRRRRRPPLRRHFEVAVIGHLRPVKDPFRTALAARRMPEESRLLVTHVGAAHQPSLARRARQEERRNPRYRWWGGVPRSRAMALLARCRVLVLSSRLEGGANVLSEALATGTPVLASRIPGSEGLLGPDHPGWFPVGDTAGLAGLLRRAERDPVFLRALRDHGRSLAWRVRPATERRAWRALLEEWATE